MLLTLLLIFDITPPVFRDFFVGFDSAARIGLEGVLNCGRPKLPGIRALVVGALFLGNLACTGLEYEGGNVAVRE